jgi:CRP/FNR family transcriptional regulator, cyclic AMP receptor protein
VTGDGVVIGLRLTHEVLGCLVGARRPTVTLALKDLGAAGHVRRRDDGRLVLTPASREYLAPGD